MNATNAPPPGYEAARAGAALFDVSARGKIEAEGKDAAVFLHNVCTNDVKGLPPSSGREAFFCTATAKVVAHGWIYREPPRGKQERLWVDVGPGQGEKVFRHLDRHIVGDDVTVTDRTAALAQLHLCGPNAAAVLRAAVGLEPPAEGIFVTLQGADGMVVVVRESRRLGLPGFDLLCPAEKGADWSRALVQAGAVPASHEAYEVLRVEAGMPEYGIDMDENTFAPEVGRVSGISYQKGCYLGQEPIVMARDRGVVQRTLVGLLAGEPAPAGSLLSRDGKEVGRVTSSVVSPRLGAVALAYAKRGSQAPGTELELAVAGSRRVVKVVKLPFES
jgi:folate-binding protein YgfZ